MIHAPHVLLYGQLVKIKVVSISEPGADSFPEGSDLRTGAEEMSYGVTFVTVGAPFRICDLDLLEVDITGNYSM